MLTIVPRPVVTVPPAPLFGPRAEAALFIEQMARLLCAAHAALHGISPAPAWDALSPTVRDTFRDRAQLALARLDRNVEVRAQHQAHREFGPQGLAAIQAYDGLLRRHAPASAMVTGGSAA